MTSKYLTRAEASAYIATFGISVSPKTLAKYACLGGGPAYRLFGMRALYTAEDIDTWLAEKISPVRYSATA